jgi:hypothetical protein
VTRWPALASTVLLLAATVAGCESTQTKSARLKAKGGKVFQEKGLDVKGKNESVKVVQTRVLQDSNGAAAVVVLRSTAPRSMRSVPVEIAVRGASGKTLFRNNAAGIEPSLVGPSLLAPGHDFAWVNDQVVASGKVASVKATVGKQKGDLKGSPPKLVVSSPRLQIDPSSGPEATGTVTNRSKLDQRELTLYCVARKGSRIVAAGRGGIPRIKPGQKRAYQIFFIGNPRGARLTVEAPPTTLQ